MFKNREDRRGRELKQKGIKKLRRNQRNYKNTKKTDKFIKPQIPEINEKKNSHQNLRTVAFNLFFFFSGFEMLYKLSAPEPHPSCSSNLNNYFNSGM